MSNEIHEHHDGFGLFSGKLNLGSDEYCMISQNLSICLLGNGWDLVGFHIYF